MERKYNHQFKINSYLFDEVFEEIKKINKLLTPLDELQEKIGFQKE